MEKPNSVVSVVVENDSTQIKKEKLLQHVPFITMMVAKVTGTEFERKWKLMHECIVSKKKK